MNDRSLLEQVLQAWRVNNAINLKLVSAIPKKGFDAVSSRLARTHHRQTARAHAKSSFWLAQVQWRLPEKVALREIWYPWYGRNF